MQRITDILRLLVFVLAVANGCSASSVNNPSDKDASDVPVYALDGTDYIRDWVVIGPFPSPPVKERQPDGSLHLGFYKDYLSDLGGESRAVLTPETTATYTDEDGKDHTAKARVVKADEKGIVDFEKLFPADFKVAYAFCYIRSQKEQDALFYLGSDDGVKVWINGELAHKNYVGRRLNHRDDRFVSTLHKGLNPVLVKVSDRVSDWGFVLEALDEVEHARVLAEDRAKHDFKQFLNCRVVPQFGNAWDYTFGPGKFPGVEWDKPYLVEKVMGKFPLKARWFNAELNEVSTPEKPGRYALYVEGKTPKGKVVRRASTVYCRPKGWFGWSESPKAYLDFIPADGVEKAAWEERKDAIAAFAGRTVLFSILRQEQGAVLMSYLHEMKSTGDPPTLTDTPIIRDHDYHLALKRKLLGVENKWPALKMPRQIDGKPATVLHEGSEQEASVKAGTAEKIRKVCEQWYQDSGEPFVTLVARHGVIIIHEAFGEGPDGKVTLETATEMASLTKLVTGVMFAQLVDQGLAAIDDPVGKFLPDFPIEGDKAITLRHCFTHTTGLSGHEEWGGLHNPWLENVVANQLDRLPVSKVHIYNGMGYDLAGRVMEMAGGKSIFRLMRENFFDPLGLENTFLEEDLGFSTRSTAGDFARIGQLLLNRGSYGNLQFFSPRVFEMMLPKPLNDFYPDIKVEWGIGLTWMRMKHPEAGKNGLPRDKTILSKNVIGHGSATSAILRVDLDNDLVIAQTRRRGGKNYGKHLTALLMAIDNGLIE
jgi:CubicO group peptidase (beta-lactamase class C family)